MVRPGLSGLSQVKGRNLLTARQKARLDSCYARVRNGKLDLEILLRTVATLVSGRGYL
jgi:lipopolysaccharide/colanic/teichoic acid biosynthesis glycosyltransferase